MRIKIDPLDKLFSSYIRLIAEGKCEYCGRDGRLETSHFHGRRKRSVRWDEDNCAALCHSCHRYLGENPYVHTEWFKKRLGSERLEQLNIRAEQIQKVDKEFLMEYYKRKLEGLDGIK